MLLNIGMGLAIGGRSSSSGGGPSVPEPFQTLFDHASQNGGAGAVDADNYTLGVVLETGSGGWVDQVSIWKPASSTQASRDVGLWNTNGLFLVGGTLVTDGAAGSWVTVDLDAPYYFTAGEQFVAGVEVDGPDGYSAQSGGFSSAVTNGDLTAVDNDLAPGNGNGRFLVFGDIAYPSQSFGAANYWVDVRFQGAPLPPLIPSGYPRASNTGHTGTPTTYGGSLTISSDDVVLENLHITGEGLVITGNNVTIRNCLIEFTGFFGIDTTGATGTTIEDNTIIGSGVGGVPNACILASGTITGNDCSGAENGIVLLGGVSTVTDNYVHGLASGAVEPHYDGITVQGGQTDGTLIEHNTVDSLDTSCIFIKNDFGAIDGVTVNDNVLFGEMGYNIYVEGADVTNIVVSNNKMRPGGVGYFSISTATPTLTGNTNLYTGLEI